jgi:hypothetical protein
VQPVFKAPQDLLALQAQRVELVQQAQPETLELQDQQDRKEKLVGPGVLVRQERQALPGQRVE